MTPFSFDLKTAKNFIGDTEVRSVENQARKDAELNLNPNYTNKTSGNSYSALLIDEFSYIVYMSAYKSKLARIERLKNV